VIGGYSQPRINVLKEKGYVAVILLIDSETPSGEGAIIVYNNTKNGLEVAFSTEAETPLEEVLALVKEHKIDLTKDEVNWLCFNPSNNDYDPNNIVNYQ
jgi:hypothetical protein